MRIALAQINPVVGDIEENTKKIISIIKRTNADIVVFPELSITGYSPQDLILNHNLINTCNLALNKIVQNTKNKSAIVGFIQLDNELLYNSSAVIKNQQVIAVHKKICLPNYKIFDEKRWFNSGKDSTVFEFNETNKNNKFKIGLSICEDIWFPEILKAQKGKGAELIINISASPYSKGKIEIIENILKKRWSENNLPIIYVNHVGSQDGIVYYGHSMYFNYGRIMEKCKDFEEDIKIINILK